MQQHVTRRSDFRLEHSEELQGLRALAVSSVFLYHLDSRLLPSGFTGVDVFFVLSGFLIGRKLLSEFDETGRIRFFAFTAARAKRLLPNAALVLIVVAAATWLFLPPYRFTDTAADLTASALFFSNFHFATEAVDYLRIGTPPSPVLHFWSLSIEEQFYLGLPALMLAVGLVLRRRQIEFVIGLVALIAVASFALGWSDLQSSQPAAFFETQNRIWQLAVGVLTGWSVARLGAFLGRPLSLCLAFAACTGLAWSTTMLVGAYPGPNALFPTLSTVVLLFAMFCGPRTRLHQALASPVSRWIGNRSYSIYLWHWPMIVIAGVLWPGDINAVVAAALLSVIVAHLAYVHLEQPLRYIKAPPSWVLPRIAAAVSAVVVAAICLRIAPLPQIAEERLAEIERASRDFGQNYADGCHLDLEDVAVPDCDYGVQSSKKTVMLFGDSHAARWFEPIRIAAEESGWRFSTRTKTSCPSVIVDMWYPPRKATYAECSEWRAAVLAEIARSQPDVLIIANYSNYDGWIVKNGLPTGPSTSVGLWRQGFEQLMERLPSSVHVVSIRDNPQMFTNFLDCLSFSNDCARSREEALSSLIDDRALAKGTDRKVQLMDFTDEACGALFCSPLKGDRIIFQDYHHFTSSFTQTFSDKFKFILLDSTPQ